MPKIRLTEDKFKYLINKSVQKVLNEINWVQADAIADSADRRYNRCDIMDAIETLQDALASYSNYDSDLERGEYSFGDDRKYPNSQAAKLEKYLDEINDFFVRKDNQRNNLQHLNNDKFTSSHDGMTKDQYITHMSNKYDDLQKKVTDDEYVEDRPEWNDAEREFMNSGVW